MTSIFLTGQLSFKIDKISRCDWFLVHSDSVRDKTNTKTKIWIVECESRLFPWKDLLKLVRIETPKRILNIFISGWNKYLSYKSPDKKTS